MRQLRLVRLMAGLLPLAAVGCVQPLHLGSPVPARSAIHIQNNQTTERQLVQQFGPPGSLTDCDADVRVLTWTGSRIVGEYNLGVTVPLYGASGDQQSAQHVDQTSLIATLRDHVVIEYAIVDRTDGNNWTTLKRD